MGGGALRSTTCGSGAGAALLSRLGSAVARRRKSSLMLKPSLAEVSMKRMSCSEARASISAELTWGDIGEIWGRYLGR